MPTYRLCFFSQALDNVSDDPMYKVFGNEIKFITEAMERQRISEVSSGVSVKGDKKTTHNDIAIKRLGSKILIEFDSCRPVRDTEGRMSFNYLLIEGFDSCRDVNSLMQDIEKFSEIFLSETGRGSRMRHCDIEEIKIFLNNSKKSLGEFFGINKGIVLLIIISSIILLIAIKLIFNINY